MNLFIAVVINNLEATKLEHQAPEERLRPRQATRQALEEIRQRLEHIERALRAGLADNP